MTYHAKQQPYKTMGADKKVDIFLAASSNCNSIQFIYFTNFMNTKKIHLRSKCTIQEERKKGKRQTVNYLQKSNLTIPLLQIDCK